MKFPSYLTTQRQIGQHKWILWAGQVERLMVILLDPAWLRSWSRASLSPSAPLSTLWSLMFYCLYGSPVIPQHCCYVFPSVTFSLFLQLLISFRFHLFAFSSLLSVLSLSSVHNFLLAYCHNISLSFADLSLSFWNARFSVSEMACKWERGWDRVVGYWDRCD